MCSQPGRPADESGHSPEEGELRRAPAVPAPRVNDETKSPPAPNTPKSPGRQEGIVSDPDHKPS
jgi:hypothetical protein